MISKHLTNHYGIDLKSSDLDRPDVFASDMLNAQYAKTGATGKRKGYRVCGTGSGGHGAFNYNRIDPVTGSNSDILLSASDTISRLLEATFTISYSGAETVAIADLFFNSDTSTYKLQLVEGTSIVLDTDLGKGFDESSPITLAALKTSIDAIAGFSATISGTTTLSAALLSYLFAHDLIDSDATAKVCYWENVNSPLATPLAGSEANKNSEDFENVSFAQLNNVVYMGNGYDEVLKYDGQNLYRAGLPKPTTPTTAAAAGAGIAAGTYQYRYIYRQKDAVGNIAESNLSDADSIVLGGASNVDVTVTNLEDTTGFNTNAAIVAGAQVSVTTITVDDGSGGAGTLLVGDTAYFFDSISGGYVERLVEAVTATTIDIAGAAVTVADNAVISNNLRIQVARSEDAGTFVFEVEEIPNNPFVATQIYTDSTPSASLGIQVLEPIKSRGLPPKGRYVTSYNNQLMIAGDPENPNTFYWSDTLNPEYFPIGSNSEVAQSKNGDPISAIIQSNEVMAVFEKRATHIYSGDFTDNNIRHDIVSHRIGCVAHATAQQNESEVYFLSVKGVYSIVSGQIPIERSGLIEPLFDQDENIPEESVYKFKRAVAVNDTNDEKYICLLPTETTTGGDVHVNSNYLVVVNDYSHNTQQGDRRDVWLTWRYANTNPAGGMVFYQNNLHFIERRYSEFNSSVDHNLCKRLNDGRNTDHQDNVAPVTWRYNTAWYDEGEPSVFKRYLRIKVFNIPTASATDTILSVTTEKDFTEGLTKNSLTMDISGAGSGYGVNPYGVSGYGDIDQPNVKSKLNGKFKSIRVIFENAQDERNVELSGWELELQAPYRPEIKE